MDKLKELESFIDDLRTYHIHILGIKDKEPSRKIMTEIIALQDSLQRRAGRYQELIEELSGHKSKITRSIKGHEHDMDIWIHGLKLPLNEDSYDILPFCIEITKQAIGKLEDDIKKSIRDKTTGGKIEKAKVFDVKPLKAFIAHEGETRALTMLKEFLEALGVKYFIAESEASSGRSIEGQVDWTQSNADFAICLATKGKAINKKTGRPYIAPNVIDELGRARQVFGNKIILLLQKGVEPHTNIAEIVHERFTTTNMEKAFIKIAK